MDTIAFLLMLSAVMALPMALGWFIFRVFRPARGPIMVCIACEHHGPTVVHTRGSTSVELVLWLLLIVPGLIYSVWRLAGRSQVCEECGGSALVPPSSPVGRRVVRQAVRSGP